LVSNKNTAVQLRGKVTDEFFTTGHVLVHKNVFEFVDERLVEKLSDQFESQTRLKLL
jgi:hypothetical protein